MAAPKDDLDLDPVEAVEDDAPPKKKGKRGADDDAPEPKGQRAKGRAKDDAPPKKTNKRDDDEDDEPRRLKKVNGQAVPYPPQPENLPEGLADYPAAFKRQQKRLLAGLVLFLTLYIGAVLFFALFAFWCVWSFEHLFPIKVIGLVFSALALLFLVKGFFKRPEGGRDGFVELTEDEHPVLFEFVRQLCDEVGAPEPNRLLVSADVNAMCIAHTSLFSLFKEPKKDVLLGLGLVNAVNLSEFKAILAHELGHFSHFGNTSTYIHIIRRVVRDMVQGEDVLDRLVEACKSRESFKWLGYAIGGPLWLGRKIIFQAFKMIVRQERAVGREEEFHADLVAVSAAGSNASAHMLLRVRFAAQCFMQALRDLSVAMDHKMYTNDLYLHQDRAAPVVRRLKKEPTLGLPPAINAPTDGQNVEVFDAEEDEIEDNDETPPMWRSHPCDADREKNAKRRFVPAVIDHRSPWLLFGNPADLRERLTYKFLRMVFKIPKNTELTDAVAVQKFIDNEHADTTYDPKYKGCYDDRVLEPGDISELNALVKEKPWDDDRMEKVLDKLYDGCEKHTETYAELHKELQALRANIVGRPSPKTKRKIEELEKEQDENWEWFKSFDRRVYLLHVQMAAQVDKDQKDELVERYRFQLEVQRLFQESRKAYNNADLYFGVLIAVSRGELQLGPDFFGEVMQEFRKSWKALKNIIKDAREINLPAMKNFEEGENLASFILEGKMVPEPPLSYVKGVWIQKLLTQLQGVRQKCARLHFKSVGGILAIQESVAAKWKALREPVSAEILEPEPVAAEILPPEPVAAEVIAAEVLPATVTAAEVIAAEVVAAEVLPATVTAEVPPPPVVVAPPPAPEPAPPPAVVAPPAPVVAAPPVAPVPEPAPVVAAPEPPPPEPAPAVVAEIVAAEVVADVVADVVEPEPPAPAPVTTVAYEPEPVFSLDALSAAPSPVIATVAPAPAAPVSGPAVPVVAAFVAPSPPPAPAKPVAADDLFSLDADDHKSAAPAPAEVPFSLDADDHKPKPAAKSAPAPVPAPRASEPVLSGVAPTPAARTAPVAVVPATAKRPAIKITFVKPGEKSPLAK